MPKLIPTLSSLIAQINEGLGRCIAWLTGLMALVVVAVVILRSFFNLGSIAMQESITYMHACVFLLCLAYTAQHDEHVRVDIFYSRLQKRRKAWVNACGAIVFLLPFAIFLAFLGWRFAAESWQVMEHSINAGGIPAVFLLKSLIPAAAVLLALRASAEILEQLQVLMSPTNIETEQQGPKLG